MEPSLIHSIIGNLGLHGDFSTPVSDSPNSKNRSRQTNKNKKGTQVVINISGVSTSYGVPAKPDDNKPTFHEGFHAVFLNTGQVYFGQMERLTAAKQFVRLKNVYYLHDINEVGVINFNIVKLGNEIHSPEDEMHINVAAITFWEKLQDNGPLVTAILNYQKD